MTNGIYQRALGRERCIRDVVEVYGQVKAELERKGYDTEPLVLVGLTNIVLNRRSTLSWLLKFWGFNI